MKTLWGKKAPDILLLYMNYKSLWYWIIGNI